MFFCDPIGMIFASLRDIKHFVFPDFQRLPLGKNPPAAVLDPADIMIIHAMAVIPMVGFGIAIFVKNKVCAEHCIIHLENPRFPCRILCGIKRITHFLFSVNVV